MEATAVEVTAVEVTAVEATAVEANGGGGNGGGGNGGGGNGGGGNGGGGNGGGGNGGGGNGGGGNGGGGNGGGGNGGGGNGGGGNGGGDGGGDGGGGGGGEGGEGGGEGGNGGGEGGGVYRYFTRKSLSLNSTAFFLNSVNLFSTSISSSFSPPAINLLLKTTLFVLALAYEMSFARVRIVSTSTCISLSSFDTRTVFSSLPSGWTIISFIGFCFRSCAAFLSKIKQLS